MLCYPNPKVELPMYGIDFTRLQTAIRETTGLAYGFLPHRLYGTTTMSFTLTLCGRYDDRLVTVKRKRGLTRSEKILVGTVIRAWSLGAGKGMPIITWPDLPV